MLSNTFVLLGALTAATFTQAQGINTISALAAIESVLPQSLQDLAITNSPSASALIASEFAAGQTPSWFSKLPHDVQTYLVPVTSIGQAPGVFLSALPTEATSLVNASYVPVATPTPSMSASMPYGVNGTTNGTSSGVAGMGSGSAMGTGMHKSSSSSSLVTSTSSATTTATSVVTSAGGGSSGGSSSSSSGMAGALAVPTAVFGAGFAGMVGIAALAAL